MSPKYRRRSGPSQPSPRPQEPIGVGEMEAGREEGGGREEGVQTSAAPSLRFLFTEVVFSLQAAPPSPLWRSKAEKKTKSLIESHAGGRVPAAGGQGRARPRWV